MGKFWQAQAKAVDLTVATQNGHHATAVHHEQIRMEPSVALGAELTVIDGIDPHLVTLCTPTAFEAEPYRLLAHALEQIRNDRGLGVVCVSSPMPGDGKTITAINLAGVLSQNCETKVLLIEGDLRRPSVGAYLGLDCYNGRGLVEAIRDPSLSIEHMITRLPQCNLAVLPAGCSLSSPYEVLSLPHLGALLEKARRSYDYIIVDAPPLVHFADCQYIGKWVDGFLVIVAAHETPRKLLEEVLDAIEPAKMIGLVFNKDEYQTSRSYQYRNYYLPPNRQQRPRRHAAPWQHVAGAKKNRARRGRLRFVWIGAVLVLFLVLGVALWRSNPISDAIQDIIQDIHGVWQKVQADFFSPDRPRSATSTAQITTPSPPVNLPTTGIVTSVRQYPAVPVVQDQTATVTAPQHESHGETRVSSSVRVAPKGIIAHVANLFDQYFPPGGPFHLQIWANKPAGEGYVEGEHLLLNIRATANVYLQVDYYQSDGQVVHLLPDVLSSNRVQANQVLTLGRPDNAFQFKVTAPFGAELLTVVASLRPQDIQTGAPIVEPAGLYIDRLVSRLQAYQRQGNVTASYLRIQTQKQHAPRLSSTAQRVEKS